MRAITDIDFSHTGWKIIWNLGRHQTPAWTGKTWKFQRKHHQPWCVLRFMPLLNNIKLIPIDGATMFFFLGSPLFKSKSFPSDHVVASFEFNCVNVHCTNSIKLYIIGGDGGRMANFVDHFQCTFPCSTSTSIYQSRDLFSNLSFYSIITVMNFWRVVSSWFGLMVVFYNINLRFYTFLLIQFPII